MDQRGFSEARLRTGSRAALAGHRLGNSLLAEQFAPLPPFTPCWTVKDLATKNPDPLPH